MEEYLNFTKNIPVYLHLLQFFNHFVYLFQSFWRMLCIGYQEFYLKIITE